MNEGIWGNFDHSMSDFYHCYVVVNTLYSEWFLSIAMKFIVCSDALLCVC